MESGTVLHHTKQENNFDTCVPFSVSDTSFLESVIDAARGSPLKCSECKKPASEKLTSDLTPTPRQENSTCDSVITPDSKILSHCLVQTDVNMDDGYFDMEPYSFVQNLPSNELVVENIKVESPWHRSTQGVRSIQRCPVQGRGHSIPVPSGCFSYGVCGNQEQVNATLWGGASNDTKVGTIPPVTGFPIAGSPWHHSSPLSRWSLNSSGYSSNSSPSLGSPDPQDPDRYYHPWTQGSWNSPVSPWSIQMKPCPGKPYWEQMRTMASAFPTGFTMDQSANKENRPCKIENSYDTFMTSPVDEAANTILACRQNKVTPEKPSVSFVEMIAKALIESPDKKLILADIYKYVLDNYPYYRHARKTWRNAIRHNLSVNECFVKCDRSSSGRGHFWSVHPACIDMFSKGDFRRHQARKVAQRMSREAKKPANIGSSAVCQNLYNSQVNFYNDMMHQTHRCMMI